MRNEAMTYSAKKYNVQEIFLIVAFVVVGFCKYFLSTLSATFASINFSSQHCIPQRRVGFFSFRYFHLVFLVIYFLIRDSFLFIFSVICRTLLRVSEPKRLWVSSLVPSCSFFLCKGHEFNYSSFQIYLKATKEKSNA